MTRLYQTNDGHQIEILDGHITTRGGNFKGVCVTACLSYMGIKPSEYKFTWSKRTGNNAALAIFRRKGYAVRSRRSALLKRGMSVSKLCKAIKAYDEDAMYYVQVKEHVLLVNAQGEVVVDTDSRKVDRRRVLNVRAVFVTP